MEKSSVADYAKEFLERLESGFRPIEALYPDGKVPGHEPKPKLEIETDPGIKILRRETNEREAGRDQGETRLTGAGRQGAAGEAGAGDKGYYEGWKIAFFWGV